MCDAKVWGRMHHDVAVVAGVDEHLGRDGVGFANHRYAVHPACNGGEGSGPRVRKREIFAPEVSALAPVSLQSSDMSVTFAVWSIL